jgi:hypothetical protein
MDQALALTALQQGSLRLEGQFIYGSNYTFMGLCQYQEQTLKVVYKPIKGERPLWDFPHQSLAKREVAAFILSDLLGWNLVPPTVFRRKNAPLGPGSAQLYIEHDPDYHYFTFEEKDREHLPMVMLFDLLINKADRKSGHLLVDPEGKLWLIDHGLSFHVEDKLRTVIWDYAGEPIPERLLAELEAFITQLSPGQCPYQALLPYVSADELDILKKRGNSLLAQKSFPLPPEDRRAYPWPLV